MSLYGLINLHVLYGKKKYWHTREPFCLDQVNRAGLANAVTWHRDTGILASRA